jgi:FkbM family methyltransferase
MRLQRLLLGVYQAVGPRLRSTSAGRRAFVASYFLYKRWLEDPFAALVRRRPSLFQGGHLLDVGANVGYTASVFAGAIDPGRQVHAFEPERDNFDLLAEVAVRRGLAGRVIPVRSAVGASDGSVELWVNRAHHGDHRVLTASLATALGRAAADSREQVPLVTIDSYVRTARLDRVALVKIDVQGYELEVCLGMAGLLAAIPAPAVALEYAPGAMRALGFDPAALLEFLASRGYLAHRLGQDGTVRRVEVEALDQAAGQRGYVDVVFTRAALV